MFGVRNPFLGKEDTYLQQDSSKPVEQSNTTCLLFGALCLMFHTKSWLPIKAAAAIHKSRSQISPLCTPRKRVQLYAYFTNNLLWKLQSHFLCTALLKNLLRWLIFQRSLYTLLLLAHHQPGTALQVKPVKYYKVTRVYQINLAILF